MLQEARIADGDVMSIDACFRDILQAAQVAYPGLDIRPETFFSYLKERLPNVADAASLKSLRVTDLYLAASCAMGNSKAIGAFQHTFGSHVEHALRRIGADPALVDDMKQHLWQLLFLPRGDKLPLITKYTGRGRLQAWVCVTAVRETIGVFRRDREIPVDTRLFEHLESSTTDPELECLKRQYREQFRRAFQNAMEDLSIRERNVLRHYIDGLNVDEVGMLYRVHRATAARWIAKARRQVLAHMRKAMTSQLRVGRKDLAARLFLGDEPTEVSAFGVMRSLGNHGRVMRVPPQSVTTNLDDVETFEESRQVGAEAAEGVGRWRDLRALGAGCHHENDT